MITPKGFMQMFSVNSVGGGSLDFHLDTHNIIHQTDYGKQQEAKDHSRHGGRSVSTDSKGQIHIFENGHEIASNDCGGSSSNDCNPSDNNTAQMG